MKKYIILLSAVFLFACSESFLDTENKNDLDSGSFFKTEKALALAVTAAYTPLAHGGMFGLNYMYKMNALDPDIWTETFMGIDVMNYGINEFSGFWGTLYTGLFRTSDILANTSKLDSIVTPADMSVYKGQLYALRGMYYFYLVTWFNKPIYYDETNVPKDPLLSFSNGTPEQFWDKLEADLTYAAAHLPEKWDLTETGRITKGMANAQLGKALLYKHYHYYLRFGKENTPEAVENLKKAKNALKNVIDGGIYKLIQAKSQTKADYQAALLSNYSYLDIPVGSKSYDSENNEESVWEIQYNDNDQASDAWLPGWKWGGNLNYAYFSPRGYRNFGIDPSLWNKFETVLGIAADVGYSRDPRAYATCYLDGDTLDWRPESGYNRQYVSASDGMMFIFNNKLYKPKPTDSPVPSKAIGLKKYNYPQYISGRKESAPFNVRVIRYADVLLMFAEACYQVDGDADGLGLEALNQVRLRAGMSIITVLDPTAIMHEREVELATEGHRYNDLIRWGYDPKFEIDYSNIFIGFDAAKNMYFPIPQAEINSNKGALKQNPGW